MSITCEFGAIPWVVVRYVWRGSLLETERLDLPEPPGPLGPVVGEHTEVQSRLGDDSDTDDDDAELLGPGESFVSVEEAARRSGVDESLIVSLVERGELTAARPAPRAARPRPVGQ